MGSPVPGVGVPIVGAAIFGMPTPGVELFDLSGISLSPEGDLAVEFFSVVAAGVRKESMAGAEPCPQTVTANSPKQTCAATIPHLLIGFRLPSFVPCRELPF